MYKYAMLGIGGLGKVHTVNLQTLEKERGDLQLQAVAGATAESFKQSVTLNLGTVDVSGVDISDCHFYADYKELLDNEKPDFVISALPTFLHEDAAIYALDRGAHVFSEKPMALTAAGCEHMLTAAKRNGKKLMIGQCLRFDPAFLMLKEYVEKNTFGKAYRAEFVRYSELPGWSWNNWILDPERSGGCVFDMHIHDVDLINWIFGLPKALRTAGTEKRAGRESIFTQYFYDDLLVLSNADWSMQKTFPFETRCLVNFENATVIVENSSLTVYQDDTFFSPELSGEACFMREMRSFLKLVIDNEPCKITSAESVFASAKLALSEVEALKSGKEVYL
jgi:predicted dehydrogenase